MALKKLAWDKHSSLLNSAVSEKKNGFMKLTPEFMSTFYLLDKPTSL
jgi:hypothetical protein